MKLGDRLEVPDGTMAVLFDMDGVLLDTLTTDFVWIRDVLLAAGHPRDIPKLQILEWFSVEVGEMWDDLVIRYDVPVASSVLLQNYNELRQLASATVHSGIVEILEDARLRGLRTGVVSNNREREIKALLVNSGVFHYFDCVTGNDGAIPKKPAPDMYIEGARRCEVAPESVVAVEDSIVGVEAAFTAGCFTIGVGTGSATVEELQSSGYTHATYASFV